MYKNENEVGEKNNIFKKMSLKITEEELLVEKVNPAFFHKSMRGYMEKFVIINAWKKVVESLDFSENGR